MLLITTPTQKQQDDVSCSKISTDDTPILSSLEAFGIAPLFKSPYIANGTHIFLKNCRVHFLQDVKNEKII